MLAIVNLTVYALAMAGRPRREQILDRAADLFATRGFHGTSVQDVGAACGISGPALYRHFASKDAMLAEMLVGISERLLAEARARTRQAVDARSALDALLDWHIDFALRHRALIVVQDRDWDSLPDDARSRVRRLQRTYIDLWVEQLRRIARSLDRAEAQARVRAVFGLLNSTPRSARLPDTQMRALLTSMGWAALLAD
jgi:AcrR family transcriptional regulator